MPGPIDIAAYLAQMNPPAGGGGLGGIPSWLKAPISNPLNVLKYLINPATAAAAASPFVYGALRKQIDPIWGLNDPWGLGGPEEQNIAQMTPYAAQFIPEQMRQGTTVAKPSPADQAAAARALRQVTQAKPPAEAPLGFMEEDFVGMDTTSFPGWGIPMYKNKKTGAIRKAFDEVKEAKPALKAPEQPAPFSEYEKEQIRIAEARLAEERAQGTAGASERARAAALEEQKQKALEDYRTQERLWAQSQEQARLKEQETARLMQNAFQMQQLEFQKQQQAALIEQRKQEQLANLRANPASWLEYASLAGQTPSIQPWMMPLGQGQFEGQAGQPLPGYQAGGQTMNLPQLTTPSTQYLNRMSPTARQQYYGYEKARTGANPADVEQRLWAGGPPSGQFPGMRRSRTR